MLLLAWCALANLGHAPTHPLFLLDFNLDGYRSKLDETGLQVANNQSASLEHKRALAEKTKGTSGEYIHSNTTPQNTEFKRTASPDVFKAVSSLIRAYQEEIDSLSTRYGVARRVTGR